MSGACIRPAKEPVTPVGYCPRGWTGSKSLKRSHARFSATRGPQRWLRSDEIRRRQEVTPEEISPGARVFPGRRRASRTGAAEGARMESVAAGLRVVRHEDACGLAESVRNPRDQRSSDG